MGQCGTFGLVLDSLANYNDKIFAITADLTRATGLSKFAEDYPERFINVGIAEQNAVAFSAGIADSGFIPFVTTFANFASLRANEFVKHFMAYMKCNIKLIGVSAGYAMELFGNTHYGLEDIGAIRSMPNVKIFSPADGVEVAKCVEYAVTHEGPMYIRLTGKAANPIVHKEDFDFESLRTVELRGGNDLVIYATGSMVYNALRVSEKLLNVGVSAKVIDVPVIKPFDTEEIKENKDLPFIFTIEEHCSIGGLGSSVSEVLSKLNSHGTLIRLGTDELSYKAAGTYEYMLDQSGLTIDKIYNRIIYELQKGEIT